MKKVEKSTKVFSENADKVFELNEGDYMILNMANYRRVRIESSDPVQLKALFSDTELDIRIEDENYLSVPQSQVDLYCQLASQRGCF